MENLMIEQWQDLINIGISTEGYQNAIEHYNNLKDKMINSFYDRVESSGIANEYNNLTQKIENEIAKNASSFSKSYQEAQETLDVVRKVADAILENKETRNSVESVLKEIQEKTKSKEGEVKNIQQYLKIQLNNNREKVFQALKKDSSIIKYMLKTSNSNADINALSAQASSYFIRYLYKQLFNDKNILMSNYKYLLSMGGFYKEIAEYEALEKMIGSYSNIIHSGDIKVGGKDSPVDILISQLDNAEKVLNADYQITKTISSLDNKKINIQQLKDQLLKDIEWFGVQVKSSSLGKSDIFKIGSREQLYSQFIQEGGNKFSTLESAHFLAQFKNILLSLGQSNVLFSANNKRYWMSDFISDFRKQNYLFTFFRSNDKSELSKTVSLEQLYTKNKNKIKSRNLRKRFNN